MDRAIIYRRVSTQEQVTNQSLGIQLKQCREHCERSGWKVDRVFTDEGESAKTTDRTEFTRLLEYCRKNPGRIQYLVVHNVSRFSRTRDDHFAVRAFLKKYGVTLRSVQEGFDDSASGEFMETVMAGFAQLDNRVRGERSSAGMKAAAEKGQFLWIAPVGYLNAKERGKEPSLVVDPVKGPLVQEAFKLYSSGRYTKVEVLNKVRALGLTSRRGKEMSPQTFTNMLQRRTYCGVVASLEWGSEYPGNWAALVDEETFVAVQAVLSGRGPSTARRTRDRPDFPLRRFVKCAQCGKPMTGSWTTSKSKRYSYYHCRTRTCGGGSVREAELRGKFVQVLEGFKPNPKYLPLFREIVLDVWKQHGTEVAVMRRKLTERIEELQRRKDELVEAFVHRKTLDAVTYDERVSRENEGLALARLELVQAQTDELDVEVLLDFGENLMMNTAKVWLDLAFEQKLRFQRVLFPDGLTFDGESFGTAVTSPVFSYLRDISTGKVSMASPTGFEPVSQP
jgi:site-specific DNA recombinase